MLLNFQLLSLQFICLSLSGRSPWEERNVKGTFFLQHTYNRLVVRNIKEQTIKPSKSRGWISTCISLSGRSQCIRYMTTLNNVKQTWQKVMVEVQHSYDTSQMTIIPLCTCINPQVFRPQLVNNNLSKFKLLRIWGCPRMEYRMQQSLNDLEMYGWNSLFVGDRNKIGGPKSTLKWTSSASQRRSLYHR